ncbi:MAG: GNAT family N-acetyltransferase [Desulfobacterium sp.]|nr:GNAT family N-acetyltransferase [Desulfobacterium sp.]MBU3947364.1 GNAT family N-acetyltransferase [Pseudomonadota bacterium]MBU4036212.1 GNAT family N-acetyltransferase [Pseudomonadota bacterium]
MYNYTFLTDPSSDHIRQITSIYRLTGWWAEDIPDDPSHVRQIIAGSHCFIIVCEENKIIGMGRAISDRISDAYVQDLTVISSYRKMGIGTQILKRIVARLENDGIKWIALIAERNSRDFYTNNGFNIMPDSTPMLKILI